MKKLLWTSAMAIAAVACLTACDETSSSSYEIPSYNSDTLLPDTCSMEVAKVDTAYYACFENKWVEVTDSATIEQLKEGLDEEEIKAKLEELQSLLPKPADNTPKPTSSSTQSEVEDPDGEGDSSSSSEEEEEVSSSSQKKKDKDDSEGGSGSGEGKETVKKCGDETYDPKTQICGDDDKILGKCGNSGYDPETQVCGEGNKILGKCGDKTYDPETQVCGAGDKVLPKCGESGYDPETQVCGAGDQILGKCGDETYDLENQICGAGDKILSKCGESGYDPEKEWCRPRDYKVIAIANTECCGDKKSCSFSYEERPTRYYDKTDEFCAIHNDTPTRIYKKVTIGTQTWMAENLDYDIAGSSHCYWSLSEEECKKYGRLYDKSLVVDNPSSICPTGWHLPDNTEWKALIAAHGENVYYGIRSTEWKGGENTLGFNLLPAGYEDITDKSFGKSALVWSSSTTSARAYYLFDDRVDYNGAKLSLSVRCVKD